MTISSKKIDDQVWSSKSKVKVEIYDNFSKTNLAKLNYKVSKYKKYGPITSLAFEQVK